MKSKRTSVGQNYNHDPAHYHFARTIKNFYPPDDDSPDWLVLATAAVICVVAVIWWLL